MTKETLIHCPIDCGGRTFCHKGQLLPEDKTICYSKAIVCSHCHLPKFYVNPDNGHMIRIPHTKSTEQYWKNKVCVCL